MEDVTAAPEEGFRIERRCRIMFFSHPADYNEAFRDAGGGMKKGMLIENPLVLLAIHYLILLVIPFVGRLVLLLFFHGPAEADHTHQYYSLLVGVRMDTMVASVILLLPALILFTQPRNIARFLDILLRVYFLAMMELVIFMECATVPFFQEFEMRPNDIFINYLEFPKEVLGNIWRPRNRPWP